MNGLLLTIVRAISKELVILRLGKGLLLHGATKTKARTGIDMQAWRHTHLRMRTYMYV